MAVAADSSNSFHIEICCFNQPVLNKICYVDLFSCINRPLTVKYTTGKSLLLNKLFSNFKL